LACLDFEAQCIKDRTISPQEIVEWPIVMVDTAPEGGGEACVVDVFHTYIRPVAHPRLTPFCKELTGITQAMVDSGMEFEHAASAVKEWLSVGGYWRGPEDDDQIMFVTCGDWDLKTALPGQLAACRARGVPVSLPAIFERVINIKVPWRTMMDRREASAGGGTAAPSKRARRGRPRAAHMAVLVSSMGLRFEGRQHSGIDDTTNLAKVVCGMLKECPELFDTHTWPRSGGRR
jgi:inhibitor of KinA sporulation pathway (predicted exonuclease)